MNHAEQIRLRDELEQRRTKLLQVSHTAEVHEEITSLLNQIDKAIENIGIGHYGVCNGCHGEIEISRLQQDPLTQFCLDCLSEAEQRELEQDLMLASAIQRQLLPENNYVSKHWEINYHYQPAGIVSGDYCDIIPINSGQDELIFIVSDVSGKGVAASMLMSHLHAIFHSMSKPGISLDSLVARANRHMCESTCDTHYATLVAGRIHQSGELEICCAGHSPPVLLQSGKVHTLEPNGFPLGIFCSSQYSVDTYKLEPGDSLLLYTDGINETMKSGEEYGTGRIADFVLSQNKLDGQELLNLFLDDLDKFSGEAVLSDDRTLMYIRRT